MSEHNSCIIVTKEIKDFVNEINGIPGSSSDSLSSTSNNDKVLWAATSDNSYEVSSKGDTRFSAYNARFNKGTIIDGNDVSGMSIEDVYQKLIKKGEKNGKPSKESKLYLGNPNNYSTTFKNFPKEVIRVYYNEDDLVPRVVFKDKSGSLGLIEYDDKYNKWIVAKQRKNPKGELSFYSIGEDQDKIKSIVNRIIPSKIIEYVESGNLERDELEDVKDSIHETGALNTSEGRVAKFFRENFNIHFINESYLNKSSGHKSFQDFSYYEGYLPLWQEWARQNPKLIKELRQKSSGKVLTDQFANTRVNQARALADILNSREDKKNTYSSNTTFSTSTNSSYPARTRENANWSDVTLAIAEDYNTRGEELTKNVSGNKYVKADILDSENPRLDAKSVLNSWRKQNLPIKNIKLNIAGNGIYTLSKYGWTQDKINDYVTELVSELLDNGVTISAIRSGGQTGIDEAGIIAAQRLGIKSEVHTTSNWKFRDINGKDISDEKAFKDRFNVDTTNENSDTVDTTTKSSSRAISEEEVLSKLYDFCTKKHISPTEWLNYKDEALSYVKNVLVNNIIPIVEPVNTTPDLLSPAAEWLQELSSKVTDISDNEHHQYKITLSDGSEYTATTTVTKYADTKAAEKYPDRRTYANIWSVHPGLVMGNSFDTAVKGYFSTGKVVKDANMPDDAATTLQIYLDNLTKYLNDTYGIGEWKAFVNNISLYGNYRDSKDGSVYSIAGTPDIIIATRDKWFIIDAKTSSVLSDNGLSAYDRLPEDVKFKYKVQTSLYKRILEDLHPELKGKIETGLFIAETIYPKGMTASIKDGVLYFGSKKAKSYQRNKTIPYAMKVSIDNNSSLMNGAFTTVSYEDSIKALEAISDEELEELGLTKKDITRAVNSAEGSEFTSEDSIDIDAYSSPVTKQELNTLATSIMNLYTYYLNMLHDSAWREQLGITDKDMVDSDGNLLSRSQLARSINIYDRIMDYIKGTYIIDPLSEVEEDSIEYRKYSWVNKHWQTVLNQGAAQLVLNEGISLDLSEVDDNYEINSDYDFSDELEQAEVDERENYVIKATETSPLKTTPAILKGIFATIPIREWNEEVTIDETTGKSEVTYTPVGYELDSTWKLPKFYSREEISNILWDKLHSANTFSEMKERMQSLASQNPFMYNVLDVLENYPELEAKFFVTMKKMKVTYTSVQMKYDKTLRRKLPTSRELKNRDTIKIVMAKTFSNIERGKSTMFKKDKNKYSINVDKLNDLISSYKDYLDKHKSTADWKLKVLESIGIGEPKLVAKYLDKVTDKEIFNILRKLQEGAIQYTIDSPVSIIRAPLNTALNKILDGVDGAASLTVFENGKAYQKYVAPNYVGLLMDRLTNTKDYTDKQIKEYIEENFLQYSQYAQKTDSGYIIYNSFLEDLYYGNNIDRDLINHSIQVASLKKHYRDQSDAQYLLSLLSEYRFYKDDKAHYQSYAKYPLPILADKPSSEFITMRKYTFIQDKNDKSINKVKNAMMDRAFNYLLADVRRISGAITMYRTKSSPEIDVWSISDDNLANYKSTRNRLKKGEPLTLDDFLTSDNKLKKWAAESAASFKHLSFLNKELENRSELGEMLVHYINGEKIDVNRLKDLFKEAYIKDMVDARNELNTLIEESGYTMNKLAYQLGYNVMADPEGLKKVNNLLDEFVWNYVFNERDLVSLFICDTAFYPNTVQVVKRFAQVHSYTDKADTEATFKDPSGRTRKFSDGNMRVLYITDKQYRSYLSTALQELFKKKAGEAKSNGNIGEYKQYEELAKKVETLFSNINVTDGQAFSSPTGFFKKYGMLGMLTENQKSLYWKIKNGTATAEDYMDGFSVLKPSTYTKIPLDTDTNTLGKILVPTYIKDSEYMLSLANLALENNEGSVLKSLYDVMEESAYTNGEYNGQGIDTVVFISAVKSGAYNVINLKELEKAKDKSKYLKSLIYGRKKNTPDNYSGFVHTFPVADWGKQQPVNDHFMDHFQAEGSQFRILPVAELPKEFNVTMGGINYNKSDFITKYFSVINDLVTYEYKAMEKTFELDKSTHVKNRVVSDIIKKAIAKDSRYSAELFRAVSLTNGNFNIPLGDTSNTSKIPGMVYSLIKNAINKVKFPGGPVVQVTGYDRNLRIHLKDDKGNPLLGYLEYIKENNLEENKDSIKQWNKYLVDNNFSINYFDFDITCPTSIIERKLNNGEEISEEERKMLAYRIPTENRYSIFHGRVRNFLNRESGETIMLPYEITLIAGLDFDVDKLYTKFKFFGDNLNKGQQLQNELFDMQYIVAQQQSSMIDSMNPGSFISLSDLADRYNPNTLNHSNIIYPSAQINFHKLNMAGKQLVAFAANARISHAICEIIGLKVLVPNFRVNGKSMSDFTEDGYASIGSIYSVFDNSKIARTLSEIEDAAVDNGKNPVLSRLGITPTTFNMYITMIRLGIPKEIASAIMLHPYIKKLAQEAESKNIVFEDAIKEAFISATKRSGTTPNDVLNKIREKNFTVESTVDSMRNPNSDNALDALGFLYNLIPVSRSIKRVMFWTRLNSTNNAVSSDIYRNIIYTLQLEDFYSRTRENIVNDSSYRTGEISLTEKQLFEKIKFLQVFSDVYTDLVPNISKTLFPQYSNGFLSLIKRLADIGIDYESMTKGLLKKMFNQYRTFLATKSIIKDNFKSGGIKDNASFNEILKKIVYDLPKEINDIRINNVESLFLDSLLFDMGDKYTLPSISIDKNILTKDNEEEITASWEALLRYDKDEATTKKLRKLSDDLITYALIKYGMDWSPNNYLSYAPNLAKLHYNGYRDLTDPNSSLWSESNAAVQGNFIRLFARNNPNLLSTNIQYIDALMDSQKDSKNKSIYKSSNEDIISIDSSFYKSKMPGILTIKDNDNSIFVIDSIGNTVTFRRTTPLGGKFLEYDYNNIDPFNISSIAKNENTEEDFIEEDPTQEYITENDPTEETGNLSAEEYTNNSLGDSSMEYEITEDQILSYVSNKFGKKYSSMIKLPVTDEHRNIAIEMINSLSSVKNPNDIIKATINLLKEKYNIC